jgi:hypothetical protein
MARPLTQPEISSRSAFIRKKLSAGSKLTDIAWEVGVSVGALSKWCTRYGIVVPKGEGRPRRPANLDAVERQQFRIPSDTYSAFDRLALKRGVSVESLVVRTLIRLGKNPVVVDRLLDEPGRIEELLG